MLKNEIFIEKKLLHYFHGLHIVSRFGSFCFGHKSVWLLPLSLSSPCACFLPLCGSSELYCLWNPVSVSLVCIFNYVLSVPAHLGLVLLCSQPGACCHCLESRLQLWQQKGYLSSLHTASWVDLFTSCITLLKVLPVGFLLSLEFLKIWIIRHLCLIREGGSQSLSIVKWKLCIQISLVVVSLPDSSNLYAQIYTFVYSVEFDITLGKRLGE